MSPVINFRTMMSGRAVFLLYISTFFLAEGKIQAWRVQGLRIREQNDVPYTKREKVFYASLIRITTVDPSWRPL